MTTHNHSIFTWHSPSKSLTIELSTLCASCRNRNPFILVGNNVALRIQGKRSVRDFVWDYNIYDRENELVAAVYRNGDVSVHVLND